MILLVALAALLFFASNQSTVKQVLSKADFAVVLFESCRRRLDISASLLATAMGVFESGYGTSAAYTRGFNVYNITAGSAWKGGTWSQSNADDEYDAAGNKIRISQVWRTYASIDESVDDYLSFLSVQNGGRYKKAYDALLRGESREFVFALYDGGYFTLAPEKYLAGVEGTLKTVMAMTGRA